MTIKPTKEELELIKRYRKSKSSMLNFIIKDYFNGVTEDDVLQQKGLQLIKNGHPITKGEADAYRMGAVVILESPTWTEIYNSLRLEANRRMFEKSETIEDIVFGKAMLLSIETIQRKLENLSKLK